MKLTFADFFSGAGGLSLGFIKAGLKCISAMDTATDANHTYWSNLCYYGWSHYWIDENNTQDIKRLRKWNPQTINALFSDPPEDNWLDSDKPMPCLNLFHYSINDIEPEQWMKMCGVRPGDVQIFAGGPPCQGFSMANSNRSEFDSRNQLPLRFIYFAKICKPRIVIMENVPGILSIGKQKKEKEGPFPRYLREAFDEAGYHMEYNVVNAADYGVPQNRKRVIFIAVRKGEKEIKHPEKTHGEGLIPYVTFRESCGHLPPLQAGENYQEEPYKMLPVKDHVICRACLQYNSIKRTACHSCNRSLENPILGGVVKIPGLMLLIDTNDKIADDNHCVEPLKLIEP